MLGVLLQLIHAGILFFRPYTVFPEFYIFPYLSTAGLVPYLQIIDQHSPGLFLLPVNFFSLGFKNTESFRILNIVLVLFQSALVKKISPYKKTSILVYTILQVSIAGDAIWFDSLIPLFTLPALYFLQKKRLGKAGLLLGLAICFKQTAIILVIGILIFYFKSSIKNLTKFILGTSVFPAMLVAYLISKNSLFDFFQQVILFNFKIYPKLALVRPEWYAVIVGLLLLTLCLVYIFSHSSQKSYLIFIFAVGSSIVGLTRFDLYHLHASIPFVSIIISIIIYQKNKLGKILVLVCAVKMTLLFFSYHTFNYDNYQTREIAKTIMKYVRPKEKIYLFGVQPHVYSMSNTLPSGNFFMFQLPWYLQTYENQQIQALKSDMPKLVVVDESSSVDGKMTALSAPNIEEFISSYYHEVERKDTIVFLAPN